MALKLRVGRKGYIILPKAIRDAVGIREGDEVIVEVGDGIIIRPARRIDPVKIREAFRRHVEELKKIKDRVEPRPGELGGIDLEEAEFE